MSITQSRCKRRIHGHSNSNVHRHILIALGPCMDSTNLMPSIVSNSTPTAFIYPEWRRFSAYDATRDAERTYSMSSCLSVTTPFVQLLETLNILQRGLLVWLYEPHGSVRSCLTSNVFQQRACGFLFLLEAFVFLSA
jgi:hypothetical protein